MDQRFSVFKFAKHLKAFVRIFHSTMLWAEKAVAFSAILLMEKAVCIILALVMRHGCNATFF
ncbi:hypothetical protein HMPREF1870_02852 [Bacteroidales bacterium KA00344]|nr:hypothetical protein HMPREF1870_02852 [Bacteroidales bacterium KA00344]